MKVEVEHSPTGNLRKRKRIENWVSGVSCGNVPSWFISVGDKATTLALEAVLMIYNLRFGSSLDDLYSFHNQICCFVSDGYEDGNRDFQNLLFK